MKNVLGMDHAAHAIWLRSRRGAVLIFDFKAAFPSVDQDFMLAVLDHLGLPDWVCRFVKVLYRGNRCQLDDRLDIFAEPPLV